MNYHCPRTLLHASLLLATASLASAQSAPVQTAPGSSPTALVKNAAPAESDNDPIRLSPFEVNTDKDIGYSASTAMSGTRTNEKLENLPNSISVMTQEFMQDLAFNNYFYAVDYAANTENIAN